MSKIKNGRELVLRAQSHARHDHIKQGTYGDGSVNGHVEFKGCAVGCLSTPHRKRDLRNFLRSFTGGVPGNVSLDDRNAQVEGLRREFGITEALADLLEAIFEGIETHGAAIEFIPAAAKAIAACEGKNITDRQVAKFRKANDLGEVWSIGGLYDSDYDPSPAKLLIAWLEKRAAR